MRKLFIQFYFLDYMTKCFGLSLKYPKAAAITYPLFAFAGMNSLYGYTPFSIVLWALTAISLFFEFVYFEIFKVKFSELTSLDDMFIYGSAIRSGKADPNLVTEIDWNKFDKAEAHVKRLDDKRFYKPWRYIMNPFIIVSIIVLITLIILE